MGWIEQRSRSVGQLNFQRCLLKSRLFTIDPHIRDPRPYFLEFVNAGGYDRTLVEWGRLAVDPQRAHRPSVILEPRGRVALGGMFDRVPLPLGWPVYVSLAEAMAVPRMEWGGLPSDGGSFSVRRTVRPDEGDAVHPWGTDAPTSGMAS